MEKKEIEANIKSKNAWVKAFFLLFFLIAYSIAEMLVMAVVFFQFCFSLITGKPNEQLLNLGRSLARYVSQVVLFITYNHDDKPYPFAKWPSGADS